MNQFSHTAIICSTMWAVAGTGIQSVAFSAIWLAFAIVVLFADMRKSRAPASAQEKESQ